MTPVTPAFDPTSLIIAAAAFAFGLLLLIVGLRGRRIGTEPRCRKCGYDLSGAASDHCSECGTVINVYNVETGTRRRRPAAIAFGLLLLALAVIFGGMDGYRRLQTVDKYRYYPFSWLIDGGHAGDLAALKELDRRLRADKLSNEQLQSIITDALAEQAAGPSISPAVTQAWINMLGYMSLKDRLAESQLQQYCSQLRRYSLIARPQVRAGEPVTIEARYQSFGPSWKAQFVLHTISVHISNVRLLNSTPPERSRSASPGRPQGYGCVTGSEPVGFAGSCGRLPVRLTTPEITDFTGPENFYPPPGSHRLVCDLIEQVFDVHVRIPIDDQAKPIVTRTLQLTADFEVLPSYAPDTVGLVDDPELAAHIRPAIQVYTSRSEATFNTPRLQPGPAVMITTGIRSRGRTLPMDVAFDVHAQAGNESWYLGEVALKAGSRFSVGLDGSEIPRDLNYVDIVLRSSPDAARQTVDIFRIWNGELVFRNVHSKYDE